MALTASQINTIQKGYFNTKNQLARIKNDHKESMAALVYTGEGATAAFAMGMVNGRWGGVELLGVPLSLLSAGGAHLLGFAGIASEHMHAFGNGFLFNYASELGLGIGARMAAEAARAAAAPAA